MASRARKRNSQNTKTRSTSGKTDPATRMVRSIKAQHTITLRKVEALEAKIRESDIEEPIVRPSGMDWFLTLLGIRKEDRRVE